MKKAINTLITSSLLLLFSLNLSAQQQTAKVGSKVTHVEVRNSKNEPAKIPYLGEKHVLIFYPDPDHGNQNKKFTDYLEENNIVSDNIFSQGIVNLKDAPMYPNGLVRSVIRKKEKKHNIEILTDPDHLLRDAWGLGDVNNLFTIIFVTSDMEIVYLKKGELSKEDQDEFFEIIEKYK